MQQATSILQWQKIKPLLILVENESTKGDQTVVAANGIIHIYSKKNRGYGGGNNLGIEEAFRQKTEYVLLLNADAVIKEDAVSKLLATMQQAPNLFAIGPKLLEGQKDDFKVYAGGKDIGLHVKTRLSYDPTSHKMELLTVDYTIGAILLIACQKLQTVGLFDDAYFFSGEVGDLCKRAQIKGYDSATLLSVEGFHYATPNPLRESLYVYYSYRNRLLYAKKFTLGIKQQFFWINYLFNLTFKVLLQRRWSAARALWLALIHGMSRKYGNQNTYFSSK